MLYSALKLLSVNFHPTLIFEGPCKILAKKKWIFMKRYFKFVESKQGIVGVRKFVAKFSHILLNNKHFCVSRNVNCSQSNGLI